MKQYKVKVFNGRTEWYNQKNQFHREDGPAVEYASGSKHWYKNGKRHRDDGPAIESYFYKCWYKDGMRHRENGPAIEHSYGRKFWYLDNKEYSKEEYNKEIAARASYLNNIIVIYGKKYKLVEEV